MDGIFLDIDSEDWKCFLFYFLDWVNWRLGREKAQVLLALLVVVSLVLSYNNLPTFLLRDTQELDYSLLF
jgi:hypothetical protein